MSKPPKNAKRLRRVLAILVVVSLALLWSAWQTQVYPADRPVPSEVGVVLGASTWKNEPSPVEVEMVVRDDGILIRAARAPRAGWAQAFAKMARAGDDALLDVQAVSNRWDAKSWQWI